MAPVLTHPIASTLMDSEKVTVRDYIDARISPMAKDLERIEGKVDRLFTKLDGVQQSESRADGADKMKKTIWRATAVTVTCLTSVAIILVEVMR